MDELPVFRANKRRKFAREKVIELEIEGDGDQSPSLGEQQVDIDNQGVNVSDLVKLRKQNRSKATGVQFSQQKRSEEHETADTWALTKENSDEEKLKDISNRFVGGTGQIVDVDKHMMAYIESEMAKRRTATSQSSSTHAEDSKTSTNQGLTRISQTKSTSEYPSQSQLSEFDLGSDAYARNLARTEAAIARAQSGLPPPLEEVKPRKPRKPRLGPDGKPWRPRPRKGRNSEDIARDALVEQMLHEHKMDLYEEDREASGMYEEDENADERLAEQFKQEFMDAMAERQQKNQVKVANAAKAKGMGPDQSGPKLGGGRSARAKMAQMQQGQQQKGTSV